MGLGGLAESRASFFGRFAHIPTADYGGHLNLGKGSRLSIGRIAARGMDGLSKSGHDDFTETTDAGFQAACAI